jgi:hypothetical protein
MGTAVVKTVAAARHTVVVDDHPARDQAFDIENGHAIEPLAVISDPIHYIRKRTWSSSSGMFGVDIRIAIGIKIVSHFFSNPDSNPAAGSDEKNSIKGIVKIWN